MRQKHTDVAFLELKVGFARAEVTPEESIRMGGYGARIKPSEGVADSLFAKAMAVESASGERAVIISADLIGFDGLFAEGLCEEIRNCTGLPRERILINYSHTHAGPIFGIKYPKGYDLAPDELNRVRTYTEKLRGQVVELVKAALADLRLAKLAWGVGAASFAMNRREFTPEGIRIGLNPRGYVDRSVPVLRISEADGKLRGVVFGYACHNTTLVGNNLLISSDYAGFAQRYVEQRFPGVHGMFLQGCGASANPYPRGTYELARHHGETLGAEVCRILQENLQPVHGPLRVGFGRAKLPIEPAPSAYELKAMREAGPYEARIAAKIQAILDSGRPWATHYLAPLAVWQFGKELTLVALPGEVVGEYVPLILKTLGPIGIWPIGYTNDYFGYLPTDGVHAEGGYEARDFITDYGFLARGTEKVILRKLRSLARRAGRDVPTHRVPGRTVL